MSDQAKPIRLNVRNRIELVNQILNGLFTPKLETLHADMKAAAQSISDAHNPTFVDLYAVKEYRPLLDFSVGGAFTHVRPVPSDDASDRKMVHTYLIAPTIYDTPRHSSQATYANLGAEDPGSYASRGDKGLRITVLKPSRLEPLRLTANEKRKIDALEKRVRKLIKEFDDVKDQLIGAVHAVKTVVEFNTTYPELRAFSKLAEYDAFVPRTDMVVVPGQLLRQIKSLGLLPKAETQQLAA